MRREFVKRRIAWGAWMVWVMGTTFGLNVEAQDRSQARSMVISRQGIVAAESPLAAQAGARRKRRGCGHRHERDDGRGLADDEWNWRRPLCDRVRREGQQTVRAERQWLGSEKPDSRTAEEKGPAGDAADRCEHHHRTWRRGRVAEAGGQIRP